MTTAIETLALAVAPVVAGKVTRSAPPTSCWPDDNERTVLQRTNAYYSFLPSSRVPKALVARGSVLHVGMISREVDQLHGVLSELWLLDEVQVGTWSAPRGDPLIF